MSEYRAVGTGFLFPNDWKQAATLLLVVGPPTAAVVVVTERAHHLSLHPGDMALPGGRLQDGESTWQAALRETNEELGIATDAIEDLGFLGYFRAAGGRYRISAHVGRLGEPPDFRPDPSEVERLVLVSLSDVVDLGRYQEIESPRQPDSKSILFDYPEYPIGQIFGATARMLLAFAQRYHRGEYVAALGSPVGSGAVGGLPPQL